MSRRRNYVITTDDRTILISGWNVQTLCREAGMKPMWSHVRKGWVLDRHKLADVVALCERQNIDVRIDDQEAA